MIQLIVQMTQIVLDFCLGFAVATYGSLVGAGGGFLLVPLFLLLYHLPHEQAVGTSLAIVTANALSGTIGYVRDRKIDYRAGLVFALCTFPGAVLGAYSTAQVSGPTFQKVFGLLLALISIYLMLRGARKDAVPFRGKTGWGWITRDSYQYYEPAGAAFSVVVGAISSWLGIGGGIIHVPFMTEGLRIPVHRAVATSHFVLGFTALVGTIFHFSQGHVHLATAIPAAAGAVLGAQLGVWLARRVKGKAIVRALALALLAVAARLVLV
jgi:uncharacterized membrane protein YfcA